MPASPATEPLLLGIDVGTTTVKAGVLDLDHPAEPIAVARTESATASPRPGWSETDPDTVWDAVVECVRDVLDHDVVDARAIAGIGVSGTACGAWLVGDGRPVRDAVLWNDARAAPIVTAWRDEGLLTEIFDRSGNVPFPGYTLPVLAWLDQHEPGALAAADTLLFCKDWVRARLTGVIASEETDASYAPFDITGRQWDESLLELAEVDHHAHLLPELLPPDTTHPLTEVAARTLGLPTEVPVAMGATDIVAGCVGGGALRPGRAVTILGTSANTSVVTETPAWAPREVGIMAAAPLGRWIRTMVTTSGSATLDWAARLCHDGDVAALLADAASAGDDVPVLVPHLAGAGVVSPYVDPAARGALLGLRDHHGPAAVARAAVEGLGLAVAEALDALDAPIVELAAVGGAARSDLLLSVLASALGVDVQRPVGEEFGVRGVALLAAHAVGLLDDGALEDAVAALDHDTALTPEALDLEGRQRRWQRCHETVRGLGSLW